MLRYRIIDNLPAATKFLDIDQNTVYSLGFPLGFVGTTEVRRALAIGLALAAGERLRAGESGEGIADRYAAPSVPCRPRGLEHRCF